MAFSRTINCKDSLGRAGVTTVSLDESTRRVMVMVPQPAAALDWSELDRVIAALTEARKQMPGGR